MRLIAALMPFICCIGGEVAASHVRVDLGTTPAHRVELGVGGGFISVAVALMNTRTPSRCRLNSIRDRLAAGPAISFPRLSIHSTPRGFRPSDLDALHHPASPAPLLVPNRVNAGLAGESERYRAYKAAFLLRGE